MSSDRCDVVVIGGGIHGAGVAQAAAAAGHSVLVLEQTGLAAGTSSRSSKLIHGGLRYLEGGHLKLVRECLRERALLLRLAPKLVQLRPFYLPLYEETARAAWQVRIGLGLYSLLAGGDRISRYHSVPRQQWDRLDGLRTAGLKTVFCYPDAQTDDAALTRAVMASAQALGAQVQMPAKVLQVECQEHGATVHYQTAQQARQVQCRVVVNAAGPWANEVLRRVTPLPVQVGIDLVQGTHILVPGSLTQGLYYLEAPKDRRAVFVMPWRGHTLVGTTETLYRGNPGDPRPLPDEIDYLWQTLAHYFPRYRSGERHIVDAFAGLRVLPAQGAAPFARSRETILHPDRREQPRIITIYGGKLTAYRATARAVMARLRTSLPQRPVLADTAELPLG